MDKEEQDLQTEEEFNPRGTIVVLIIFLITMIALWGYIYLLLIQRGVTI